MDHFQPNHDVAIFGLNPRSNFQLAEFHQMNRLDSWLIKVRQMNWLIFQQMEFRHVKLNSNKMKFNSCSCWNHSNVIPNPSSQVPLYSRQLTIPRDCQPLPQRFPKKKKISRNKPLTQLVTESYQKVPNKQIYTPVNQILVIYLYKVYHKNIQLTRLRWLELQFTFTTIYNFKIQTHEIRQSVCQCAILCNHNIDHYDTERSHLLWFRIFISSTSYSEYFSLLIPYSLIPG